MEPTDVLSMSPAQYAKTKAKLIREFNLTTRKESAMRASAGRPPLSPAQKRRLASDECRVAKAEAEAMAETLVNGGVPEGFKLSEVGRAQYEVLRGAMLEKLRRSGCI